MELADLHAHPVSTWWAAHAADLSDPAAAGRVTWQAVRDGMLDLPRPGAGQTVARWVALAALAAADVTLAKLGEAHADAVAILAELAGPDPGEDLWAVWASTTPALTARQDAGRWMLRGRKPWASGALCCSRALVSALAPDGERLFAVEVADPGVRADPDSWPAVAMSGTTSLTLTFDGVPATAVGGVGDYTARPGFWHGGAGIAACWYGGAVGIAAPLYRKVAASPENPFRAAHLGAVHAELTAAAATLTVAAQAVDAACEDGFAVASDTARADGFAVAMTARAVAETCATAVIDRVGRALGPGPLAADRAHARRVADLGLFVRQSHAEADLADLGRHVAGGR